MAANPSTTTRPTRPMPRRCTGCSRNRWYRRSTIVMPTTCPTGGSAIVKEAIRTVAPRFSARRMVREFVEQIYPPALERREALKSKSEVDVSDFRGYRRVMDDLNLVALRIAEVTRPRAIAVRPRLRIEPHALSFQKRCPAVDVIGRSRTYAQMIHGETPLPTPTSPSAR